METKTKLKSKWSDLSLFWQSTYEFVAPYDFDECIRRINEFGNKHSNKVSSWSNVGAPNQEIDLLQDNGGVCNFKSSSSSSSTILIAQVWGQLIYQSDSQTYIKLRVGFTRWSTSLLIAFLPIICTVIFVMTHPMSGPEIFVSLGIAVSIFSLFLVPSIFIGHVLKREFYYDLREALTKPVPYLETR